MWFSSHRRGSVSTSRLALVSGVHQETLVQGFERLVSSGCCWLLLPLPLFLHRNILQRLLLCELQIPDFIHPGWRFPQQSTGGGESTQTHLTSDSSNPLNTQLFHTITRPYYCGKTTTTTAIIYRSCRIWVNVCNINSICFYCLVYLARLLRPLSQAVGIRLKGQSNVTVCSVCLNFHFVIL